MKIATTKTHRANLGLPALFAVGGSLAALPAAALEMGDLTVHSKLGQPLRASIAYALAPTEGLTKLCVTLRPGASQSGLPNVGSAAISVANGTIMLTGKTAIREPMMSAHVMVNCPYTANISREYVLFIDPAVPAYEQVAVTNSQPVANTSNTTVALVAPQTAPPSESVRRASAPRRAVPKDIDKGTRIQAKRGDTLSEIAARIENRPVGLWAAVDVIFQANPDAFMDNDPNRLKAGSWLSIPSFDGSAPVIQASDVALDATPVASTRYTTASVDEPVATAVVDTVEGGSYTDVTTGDLEPGAFAIDDNPFVEPVPITENVIIDDAQLEGPTTTATSPNVPTAVINTNTDIVAPNNPAPSTWLMWLAGAGIAIIFGLLVFGRRLRDGLGTTPDSELTDHPLRRAADVDTEQVESFAVDYDLTDESPTEENLTLDADLIIGTGLEQSTKLDVAEEFGFGQAAETDVELPFEPIATTGEQSILMSEVLPEEDDYDMSVIMDATKMPSPEDVTERDLQAIEIESGDEAKDAEDAEDADGYTINQEVDYHILEQDYEDEMTATQILNEEIMRAASDLSGHMDGASDAEEDTSALPLASVTELGITAQLPAQNDDISDLDDTGINEAVTVSTSAEEQTVEMPAKSDGDDTETHEMQVESGKMG